MRRFALALLLLPAGARAAAPNSPALSKLPAGRYAMSVSGMLCRVCARAIAAEWSKLPEVETAKVDFDKESAVVTVRLDKTLTVASLLKALRRAEKVANLGNRFEVIDLRYVP
ncbi:MAG: heavy metal-associated domain-containing protein [Elusimicrobiota bacterium]